MTLYSNLFCIFLLGYFLGCCKPVGLTLNRTEFTGKLRINGIYYNPKNYNDAFFLYKNGVLHRPCGDETKTIPRDIYACTLDSKMAESAKLTAFQWGIFIVDNDIFTFENWEPKGDCAGGKTVISKGKLLNDSTILINDNFNYTRNIVDTLRFAAFYPKPDSTNDFIK